MEPHAQHELLEEFGIVATTLSGGNRHYMADDGSQYVDAFLKAENIRCERNTSAYSVLRRWIRRARLEHAYRMIDRVSRRPLQTHDPQFRNVFSASVLLTHTLTTVGEMLDRFERKMAEANRTEGTLRTYRVPMRLLRDAFGSHRSLESVTRDEMSDLFKLLRRAPANATKRYRGLSLADAISAADRRGDTRRLGGKTFENYFRNIVTMFEFAVERRYLTENPAKDRWLLDTLGREGPRARKALFTSEQLKIIFKSPLYTGCVNDEHGYTTPGSETPRRGRFWVPLLALFHGLRCNEAAQLYTEDVASEDGILFMHIRAEREDGAKCEKRLKTKNSRRRVPVHSELLRIGFAEFVARRRRDAANARLFPELATARTGYVSDVFGKWFCRFVGKTLGSDCAATFHSFRHMFRDALTDARVPITDVEMLGGWRIMQRSAEADYGRGPSLHRLREEIEKVQYSGVSLTHLYLS